MMQVEFSCEAMQMTTAEATNPAIKRRTAIARLTHNAMHLVIDAIGFDNIPRQATNRRDVEFARAK
jgi:hypothetical protein